MHKLMLAAKRDLTCEYLGNLQCLCNVMRSPFRGYSDLTAHQHGVAKQQDAMFSRIDICRVGSVTHLHS